MTKSIDKRNYVNGIGTFQIEDAAHGHTGVRCRPSQTVIQRLHHLESKFVDVRVCSVNVEALRGKSGEIVKILERMSLDICCVQETRFRGKSVKMVSRKAAKERNFFAKKLVDKVIGISKVGERKGTIMAEVCNFIKKGALAQVFSCEFNEIL